MHSISVTGNLGRDPQLKYTPEGKPLCEFSVADNGDRAGAVWFNVTAWGKLGETCAQYLTKGRAVALVGRLRAENGNPRAWVGKDGQARASFDVTAASVEFLGREAQHDDGQQENAQRGGYGPNGGEPPEEGPEDFDEIPF
jgi:single-strand DNA-binding protein